MQSITRSPLAVAALVCAAATLATPSQSAQLSTAVRDPRPLAAMVLQLENVRAWQITYEDPTYSYGADIEDVTDHVVRNAIDRGRLKVLVPKTNTLSVPALGDISDEHKALAAVVTQYNAMVGYEAFQIVQNGQIFHIVPKSAKDEAGQPRDITAVLGTKIAIGAGERSMFQLIDEICVKISAASGTPVKIGTVPQSLLRNLRTTVSTAGRKQPARAIMDEAVSRSGIRLSWRLLFDPKDRFYALNLHDVPVQPARE